MLDLLASPAVADAVGGFVAAGAAWLIATAENLRREALAHRPDRDQYRTSIFVIICGVYLLVSTL
ncbi:hypothetical protein [Halobacterium litoreum]|uniref:Uncharacterized protein n=1 Tax=Halobacterium litoreum TaxID=2039234 RepID=A0ABD5N800_9EURY|nr:hypothetical protein [Halobacterium litoreum]UHH14884.1 hypothetical protein LT972_14725 [Halobacterium litoreum]